MQTKLEAQVARLIRVTDTQAKKLAKLTQEVDDLKKTQAARPHVPGKNRNDHITATTGNARTHGHVLPQ